MGTVTFSEKYPEPVNYITRYLYLILKEWAIVNEKLLSEREANKLIPYSETLIPEKLNKLVELLNVEPKWVAHIDKGELDEILILAANFYILFRTDNETELNAGKFIVSNNVKKGKEDYELILI